MRTLRAPCSLIVRRLPTLSSFRPTPDAPLCTKATGTQPVANARLRALPSAFARTALSQPA